ncbi:MAG: TlpA disulfide reductase family protein [Dehalococcoidia bacterium]|nr:TlpA disulfide reductase family protein [Dehalococcoidia bacterium]
MAIVIALIGGIFVQRELGDDEQPAAAATSLGLLDDREAAINQPAPDFAVRDLDGKIHRLSDFHGKTVVLNFWASWCPPCRAEMPDLLEIYEERLADGDFVVLAIDKLTEDTVSAVESFAEEFGLTFPIAFDGSDEIFQRYGVRGLPSTFFIDRNGIIRARTLGPVFGNLLPDGIAAADLAVAASP